MRPTRPTLDDLQPSCTMNGRSHGHHVWPNRTHIGRNFRSGEEHFKVQMLRATCHLFEDVCLITEEDLPRGCAAQRSGDKRLAWQVLLPAAIARMQRRGRCEERNARRIYGALACLDHLSGQRACAFFCLRNLTSASWYCLSPVCETSRLCGTDMCDPTWSLPLGAVSLLMRMPCNSREPYDTPCCGCCKKVRSAVTIDFPRWCGQPVATARTPSPPLDS